MTEHGRFTSPTDGTALATYTWGADLERPRGVVQVAHGIAEHGQRYARLGRARVAAGAPGHARDPPAPAAEVAASGARLAEEAGDLPLFLLGHSMGSFAAQTVMLDHSAQYAGVVLSGSTALDALAAGLAAAEGPVGLEAFNAGFEQRTGYEWLSRDEAEVDMYVADPLCGFDLPDDAVPQLFTGADRLADPAALAGIRRDLPVLIVSGAADPVSGAGQLVELLGRRYRDAGLADVTVTLYPEARHEIFNETNRDAVTADVVAWLDAHAH